MASKPYETVETKVAALLKIEDLVEAGTKTTEAVKLVAAATGIGARTLFEYRRRTDFIPRSEWAVAVASKRNPSTGLKSECHPDALRFFVSLSRSGLSIAESYRRMRIEAEAQGWQPVAHERTLRRELDRQVTKLERRKVRRDAGASHVV
jgi:putative transposase